MTEPQDTAPTPNSDKIRTIRAYYKLCQKPENRCIVLRVSVLFNISVKRNYCQDKTFFNTLPTLLKDDSSDVIRYTVKVRI